MKEIHTIFSQSLKGETKGVLGIDDDGNLYWNSEPVVTEKKISLKWWVNLAAIIGAFSTLAIAVFTALTYFSQS